MLVSLLLLSASLLSAQNASKTFLDALHVASFKVVLADGQEAPVTFVSVGRTWNNGVCALSIKNVCDRTMAVREVVVFDFQHGLPGSTSIYGEGFQMLSQTEGTIEHPEDVGEYTDRNHYKIPEPDSLRTVYGMLTLQLQPDDRVLLATTSCNKFISRFSFNGRRLRISMDCENLVLAPGKSWNLEEFIAIAGPDREQLFDRLTAAIAVHHPRLKHDPVPVGWCSWYCFGPNVTAKNIEDNTAWITNHLPALKYIQIDDGYQPWMGDWLETGKAFNGGTEKVLKEIKQKGLQPAIWVAPFIASPESKLFRDHPDWFVKDESGQPLRSDKIGFGGWRLGPWYVLDGTQPAVQEYLTNLFKTMREKWGCTYFKLDANYWGAMHGGVHYDKHATRIEAYRRGMEAIRKGAGDALLLGCNHPVWASLGLIQASRSSMDISRSWQAFADIGRENLLRGWQNGRLWWNDPDCVALLNEDDQQPLPENEVIYHATNVYATGGMLLSGDDLTIITPAKLAILQKLIPPAGVAARFENEKFEVGITKQKGYTAYSIFNRDSVPANRRIVLPTGRYQLTDVWTGEDIGVFEKEYVLPPLAGHSARLIKAVERK